MKYIGIDPGVHTGLAIWDSKTRRLELATTLAIHQALELVNELDLEARKYADEGESVKVIFEDARLRKWLPRERNISEYRGRLQGAGSVKRDCTIWEVFLQDKHIPFEAVAPAAGRTKWSEETFQRMTGYVGRTSNHARDAAVLVFGK